MCVSWAEPGCIILDNVLGYMHYWVMLCEGWIIGVEIKKFHSDSTKNTSLGIHFRFVIFSLFQFVSFRNV